MTYKFYDQCGEGELELIPDYVDSKLMLFMSGGKSDVKSVYLNKELVAELIELLTSINSKMK